MQTALAGRYTTTATSTLVIDPNLVSPLSYINPSHILSHTTQAGSSNNFTPAQPKRKSPASMKRKRTNTPEETTDSPAQRKNRDGPKKKKANRACFHCQKAHLTCDDSRPCQRCIKRGISTSCTEGHRKKAKYLLDDEELEQLKRSKSSAPENNAEPPPPPIPPAETFHPPDPLFSVGFDSNFGHFGSEAADREYNILSHILGSPSTPDSGTQLQYQQGLSDPSWPVTQHQFGQPSQLTNGYPPGYGEAQISLQPPENAMSSPSMSPEFMALYPSPQRHNPSQEQQIQYPQQFSQQSHPASQLDQMQPRYAISSDATPDSRSIISPVYSNHSRSSTTSVALASGSGSAGGSDPITSGTPMLANSFGSQLKSINDRVTAPFDYTEGYHFLMKHLHSRFEKNDILRIVRALAIFRPSLIALQMPLSVEDEVFVEKCFQRSLLELEKLICFSGTPTVVWRRTGEVCLVAPEFIAMTGWSRQELLGERKYIYELFENQSVVEYWENFALHAFENTTKTVNSHCVLLRPSGGPIPCTFCFSVRRDLFDLPSLVIGQWLPLL